MPSAHHPSDFRSLGVPASLCSALADRRITEPTPIQAVTLPDSLKGRDVLGRGRTGSGKTYAFLLPVVADLMASGLRREPKRPHALILAPTRELATQIAESLEPLAKVAGLRSVTIFGGVGQNPQAQSLARGVDIAVACPGRLEDLMGQGLCDLSGVRITVLDEADHMADMGFLPVVRRVMGRTPKKGQRLLFSATLDNGVDVLAKRYLHDPVTHHADSPQSPVATMEHHVLGVEKTDRVPVLIDLLSAPGRTVVFTRTKYGAKKLAKQLTQRGVPAVDLHGNLSQNARQRNLTAFHDGSVETLVATDIAARGIHVDDVARVVHADPPVEHKAYLHRSGRTARAGAEGTVITLMTPEQRSDVRGLMKAAKITPTTTSVEPGHPLLAELAPGERVLREAPEPAQPQQSRKESGQGSGGSKGGSGAQGRGRGAGGGRGRSRGGRRGDQRSEQSPRAASGSVDAPKQQAARPQDGSGRRRGGSRRAQAGAGAPGGQKPSTQSSPSVERASSNGASRPQRRRRRATAPAGDPRSR